MTTPEDTQDLPPAPVAEEPEWLATPQFRYQKPFTAWVVFDPVTGPVYACESRDEANDHIQDAVDREIYGAGDWQFRELVELTHPQPAVLNVDKLGAFIGNTHHNKMTSLRLAHEICNWIEEQQQ